MAFHMQLRLPRFRLTQRSTDGTVVQKDIGRGLKKNFQVSPHSGTCEEGSTTTPTTVDHEFPYLNLDNHMQDQTSSEPSFYTISRKESVAAWNSIRYPMLEAVTESYAMPEKQGCTFCSEAVAKYRCIHCGPYCYYCDHCVAKLHMDSNIFHVPEQWKVSV